jgi:N-acyl-D-amino-acid deacylase
VSHLRGYGPDVEAGLGELAEVGRGAGARVHASHLWGKPADIEAALLRAEGAGLALSFDMYTYRRSSTILAMLLLPPELQTGGPDATLAALTNPQQRAGLLAGPKLTDPYLRNVYLGNLPPAAAGLAGLSIADAAARSGRPAGEWVLDLLADAGLNVGGHLDRPTLTEADLAWLADNDRHCAGSDGIYQGQRPHPRGYSAFARLAGHYLAGDPQAGYQRLARHLAANAADVFGLRDRGRIRAGLAADICVIGPGGLTAQATYDAPLELATGADLVLVNGAIVWRDSAPVPGHLPGDLVT